MFRAAFLIVAIAGAYAMPATSGVTVPAFAGVICSSDAS